MLEDDSLAAPPVAEALGPALHGALEARGFTSLTEVQRRVLDPALADRDLRITSQTGSGKTVAIGLVLRALAASDHARAADRIARPRALVVAPTRELAKQVEEELSWLYAKLGARVTSATGGVSLRDERRALAQGPKVVVGTPGRLLDHLDRGAINAEDVGAVVLDEADRMLDLGFRDELERILAHAPEGHRTHLVSATFPREVRALADRVQTDPAHVEGTRLGEANADIDHVIYLVDPSDKFGAIVNSLLAEPDDQVLVFARTRADVADLAEALARAGFAAASLSGEMEQPARDRALGAFKSGALRVLVATDVAARGIDVQDIGRVIHADPPGDADSYTHRSGRTGRAGRKGTSAVLVPPAMMDRAIRLLRRAGVGFRFEAIPSADMVRRAADDRLVAALVSDTPRPADTDARALSIAAKIMAEGDVTRTLARLVSGRASGPLPLDVRVIAPPSPEKPKALRARPGDKKPYERPLRDKASHRTKPFGEPPPFRAEHRSERAEHRSDPPPFRAEHRSEPPQQPRAEHRSSPPPFGAERRSNPPPDRAESREVALFQVTWGEVHGADARRVLAMVCRRGGIESSDVGAIRIGRVATMIEVKKDVADRFANAAGKVDKRDPRIVIRPWIPGSNDDQAPSAAPHKPSWHPPPSRGKKAYEPRTSGQAPPKRRKKG